MHPRLARMVMAWTDPALTRIQRQLTWGMAAPYSAGPRGMQASEIVRRASAAGLIQVKQGDEFRGVARRRLPRRRP